MTSPQRDIELSDDHDLVIEGGDLQIIERKAVVRQRVLIKLKLFLGEYFLDTSFGVAYFPTDQVDGSVLGKGTPKDEIEAILKNAILDEQGIVALISFSSDLDRANRSLLVSFRALSDDGTIEVVDEPLLAA